MLGAVKQSYCFRHLDDPIEPISCPRFFVSCGLIICVPFSSPWPRQEPRCANARIAAIAPITPAKKCAIKSNYVVRYATRRPASLLPPLGWVIRSGCLINPFSLCFSIARIATARAGCLAPAQSRPCRPRRCSRNFLALKSLAF